MRIPKIFLPVSILFVAAVMFLAGCEQANNNANTTATTDRGALTQALSQIRARGLQGGSHSEHNPA